MDNSSNLGSWGPSEFSHIKNSIYLDHAGATPYCKSQLEAHYKDLTGNLYGNPHSNSTSSKLTTEAIEFARDLVLRHFNTNDDCYDVVFTSGCTEALRLVANIFPWSGELKSSTKDDVIYLKNIKPDALTGETGHSCFCYLEDNHTSVLGMREVAAHSGARIVCATENVISQKPGHLNRDTVSPLNAISSDIRSLNLTSPDSASPSSNSVSSDLIPPDMTPPGLHVYHLFAYPAQSNFSGRKYPLSWTTDIPNNSTLLSCSIAGQWLVLLDAASYVATNPLDLAKYPAHFITLSFYKIFGYPTGLGALLVRTDISRLLQQRYFGGGTVIASIARCGFHRPRPLLHERLENGTVSFLDIISLRYGFEALDRFGLRMELISQHTFSLARHVYTNMAAMKHANDTPLCVLYHKEDFRERSRQGGIVVFNLLRSDGSFIGYSVVHKLACVYSIQLRTGCFCNPGACQSALGLSTQQILDNMEAGHACGDDIDIVNGLPTGCVRVSFGYMSTYKEANMFLQFLQDCFLNNSSQVTTDSLLYQVQSPPLMPTASPSNTITSADNTSCNALSVGSIITAHTPTGETEEVVLDKLLLYPVKSCAGFEVSSWPMSDTGLLYDRQWMIVNEHSGCVTQKQEPRLACINTSIDPGLRSLTLSLGDDTVTLLIRTHVAQCNTRVCGDKVQGGDCGDDVASWLHRVLNKPYRLVHKSPGQAREAKKQPATNGASKVRLSLSNEAQYLLVTWSAVEYVHRLMGVASGREEVAVPSLHNVMLRFRPNMVVRVKSNTEAFTENKWTRLAANDGRQTFETLFETIGDCSYTADHRNLQLWFQVVGECTRCNMICVDQTTGNVTKQLLQTLLSLKGNKPTFGIYLSNITRM